MEHCYTGVFTCPPQKFQNIELGPQTQEIVKVPLGIKISTYSAPGKVKTRTQKLESPIVKINLTNFCAVGGPVQYFKKLGRTRKKPYIILPQKY